MAEAPPGEEPSLTDADLGPDAAGYQGSIPAGLATAPLGAPWGAGSSDPLVPAPLGDLAAPVDPAAMLVRDS